MVEAREAGAAGVVGVVAAVSAKGTPLMSSFAAALGLDCPVEVVNRAELLAMEGAGVPFYGVNMAVALSIPGFQDDIAKVPPLLQGLHDC